MSYHFDFNFLAGSLGALLAGLKVTLELAVASNIMGLVLGFLLCLLVMSRWAVVRWPAQLFIEFFRCTPALLQIVWFFYCIPMMVDVFIDPIVMGVLALGLNLTAFNAEAYRAGVQAVPKAPCLRSGRRPHHVAAERRAEPIFVERRLPGSIVRFGICRTTQRLLRVIPARGRRT